MDMVFSSEQLKAISSILADLGQVRVASAVIPFVVPHFRPDATVSMIGGFIFAIFFFWSSVNSVKHL